MKIRLYIIFLLLTTNTIFPQQLLQQFKASQGVQPALTLAKDSGMVNPVLVSIGTMTGRLPAGAMNLTLDFDENKGTSTVWIYAIKDLNNPDDIRLIGVIRMLLFFPIQLPSELASGFPIEPDTQLPAKWKDSDELMNILKNYGDYSDFSKTYQGTELIMLGLGVNKINPRLQLDEPYWAGVFRGVSDTTATITCFVNATTGNTSCIKFVSVEHEDFTTNTFEIYPNPAQNVIYIINGVSKGTFKISLYDELGRIRKVIPNYELNNTGQILSISVADLSAGVYFIRITHNNESVIKPIIIEK